MGFRDVATRVSGWVCAVGSWHLDVVDFVLLMGDGLGVRCVIVSRARSGFCWFSLRFLDVLTH